MRLKEFLRIFLDKIFSDKETVDYVCGAGEALPLPLSLEEETQTLKKLEIEEEKEGAKALLIQHNLRLVVYIAAKFDNTGVDNDDLVSIGTIGLIKAIDSFNPKNGARFATYAGKCLQNEILMHFRAQKKCACEVSLSETIDTDKEGNPLTYGDVISVEDTIADDLDAAVRSAAAKRIIKERLDARARRVICLRYGLFGADAMTQREVAEKMGISRSYVSRIEKAALEEIAAHISEYSV